MVALRDGSKAQDGRLARLVKFDKRSRKYPVRAALDGKKPRSFTWACTKWLDQGEEGACTGFSVTHELIARPSPVTKGMTPAFAREQVYWEAQKIDEWPGGAYPGAKPRSEGSSVLAAIQVVQKLGYIKEYRWAFGLDDLILAVGHLGPAVLGINWYEGMFEPDAKGLLHVSGKLSGGHAILCNGVSIKSRTFNLHNSWGKDWGKGGDAKISWKDMDRLLHEQGEAVIPLRRKII